MLIAFGQQDSLTTKYPLHPEPGPEWLWIVVWVANSHVPQRIIIHYREALTAKWEKITYDTAVLLVPSSLRYAYFARNDSRELTP